MAPDAIQAAAAAIAGVPVTTEGLIGEATGKRKVYPSPMKYNDNEWARELNGFLDKAGDPDVALLATPASTVKVGQCAMATAEAWGVNAEGKEVPIHPGWLLLFSVLAYVGMVAFIHFVKKKSDAKVADPAERVAQEARLASLAE